MMTVTFEYNILMPLSRHPDSLYFPRSHSSRHTFSTIQRNTNCSLGVSGPLIECNMSNVQAHRVYRANVE